VVVQPHCATHASMAPVIRHSTGQGVFGVGELPPPESPCQSSVSIPTSPSSFVPSQGLVQASSTVSHTRVHRELCSCSAEVWARREARARLTLLSTKVPKPLGGRRWHQSTSSINGCEWEVLEMANGKVWRMMTSQSVRATRGKDRPSLSCVCGS